MLKVDHIPGRDEKVLGQMLGKFPGGMVANYLSAAAAFGAKCGAVVSVGEDDFGRLTLGDLEKRGVDISHSIVRPGEDTYFTVTNLDASGEKSMSICQTAAISPYPEEVDFDYLAEAKYVHMIGTYPHLVLPVGREAKKRGVRVSLDFEPESDRMTPEQKAETLSLAYIVFPNEEGLACYVGHRDLERGAREMLAQGPEIVVVTRGAAGCEVFTKEAHFAVPAFQVPVRDTTGAGTPSTRCSSPALRGNTPSSGAHGSPRPPRRFRSSRWAPGRGSRTKRRQNGSCARRVSVFQIRTRWKECDK